MGLAWIGWPVPGPLPAATGVAVCGPGVVAVGPDYQRDGLTLGLSAGFGRPVRRDERDELVGDPVRIGPPRHPGQPLTPPWSGVRRFTR